MERIRLVDAVRALRAELMEAIGSSANKAIKFEVGEVLLTFQVEVERSGEGKLSFWVVELSGSQAATTTHSIQIPLRPVTTDGRPILTSDTPEEFPG